MKNFVQPGCVLTVPAPYDVKSGDFVLVGTMFGIAAFDALNGADVEIKVGGVYDGVPKVSAQAWAVGAALYWDATAKLMTTVATNNTKVGAAAAVAANPSAVGRVRLNASF